MRTKFVCWLVALAFLLCPYAARAASDKLTFWNQQRAGANYFNRQISVQMLDDASKLHIQFIRLSFSRWPSSVNSRDFLIGDADNYTGIPAADLKQLIAGLDLCQKHRVKVVLTPLSLPGGRWSQQNGNKKDLRMWRDAACQEQDAKFWQDLARSLKHHPAVVAYNIINEPMPERATTPPLGDSLTDRFGRWYELEAKGTPADLNAFYRRIVKAIRKVDRETPIMIDAGQYATVDAFDYLEAISNDAAILYAFHQYEPAAYTNFQQNKGKVVYPSTITSEDDTRKWDADGIEAYLDCVRKWALQHDVPASRIVAAEFGCNRRCPGVSQYLADNIAAFNQNHWHWAFYSFRESDWDGVENGWAGMDYELGAEPLNKEEMQAIEQNKPYVPRRDSTEHNPVFAPIKNGLDQVWNTGRDTAR
jgi:hypothetical protein